MPDEEVLAELKRKYPRLVALHGGAQDRLRAIEDAVGVLPPGPERDALEELIRIMREAPLEVVRQSWGLAPHWSDEDWAAEHMEVVRRVDELWQRHREAIEEVLNPLVD